MDAEKLNWEQIKELVEMGLKAGVDVKLNMDSTGNTTITLSQKKPESSTITVGNGSGFWDGRVVPM